MDPLRIDLNHTFWYYATETQTARVCFPDDSHASVLQIDMTTNACQAEHGTYELDGHRVLLTGYNWPNSIKFARTFSHLKHNSTNENLTPVKPSSCGNLAGSVWTTMVNDNLNIVFFDHDGSCLDASYQNVVRKEGKPYGWQWKRENYAISGNFIQAGPFSATCYNDFLQIDTLSVLMTAPAVENSGTSPLAGTVWTYSTSGYPGLIIFTSANTFTRVLSSSRLIYSIMNGTYQVSGSSITMTDGGEIKETCQISADRFTFLERTYALVTTLP